MSWESEEGKASADKALAAHLDAYNPHNAVMPDGPQIAPIRKPTGAVTVGPKDRTIILIDTAAQAVTLPAAAANPGRIITLVPTKATGDTVSPSVRTMLVGGLVSALTSKLTVQSDGTDWWAIG